MITTLVHILEILKHDQSEIGSKSFKQGLKLKSYE